MASQANQLASLGKQLASHAEQLASQDNRLASDKQLVSQEKQLASQAKQLTCHLVVSSEPSFYDVGRYELQSVERDHFCSKSAPTNNHCTHSQDHEFLVALRE